MENEALIRLTAFHGPLRLFAAAETLWPLPARSFTRAYRWPTNIGITAIDQLGTRTMAFGLPLLAVGATLDASWLGSGLTLLIDTP